MNILDFFKIDKEVCTNYKADIMLYTKRNIR